MKMNLAIPFVLLGLATQFFALKSRTSLEFNSAKSRSIIYPGNPDFRTSMVPLEDVIRSILDEPFSTTLYPEKSMALLSVIQERQLRERDAWRDREFAHEVAMGEVEIHLDFNSLSPDSYVSCGKVSFRHANGDSWELTIQEVGASTILFSTNRIPESIRRTMAKRVRGFPNKGQQFDLDFELLKAIYSTSKADPQFATHANNLLDSIVSQVLCSNLFNKGKRIERVRKIRERSGRNT